MLLATSLNVLFDYTPDIPRAVARIKAAGFDALDFNGCDMMAPWAGTAGDRYLANLAAAAEAAELPFVQAHGPMFDYFGDRAAAGVADTHRCLNWCGRLGARWMVMHPASQPGGGDQAHRAAQIDLNVRFFRQFEADMARYGVGCAIENLADHFAAGRRFGSVPEDLLELLEALDNPRFGICWDTGHAHLQHLDQAAALTALGGSLKVLHIQDNSRLGDDHLLPYHGTVDWEQVFAGLRAAGFAGAFTYEVHNAVRRLPDELRDEALGLAVRIGRWCIGRLRAAA